MRLYKEGSAVTHIAFGDMSDVKPRERCAPGHLAMARLDQLACAN